MSISGATRVAGVVGRPIAHSMSPILHNAWLAAAGIDGVYVPFSTQPGRFTAFAQSLRGGTVAGLNVTLPFKGEALALADEASFRAKSAEAANVLVFREDGTIFADNTDGLGMLVAFAEQAPGFDPKAGPVAILGAGGAARGAAAAFVEAGCPEVRIVNRTLLKAQEIAEPLGAKALPLSEAAAAFDGAIAVVNATSAGLSGSAALDVPLEATPASAVIMDMVYKPLKTPFLSSAETIGRRTVDGLAMLIGQAVPSFEYFFGQPPPREVDVRRLAIKALGL
ncbi:shikimate dehydrogenase [Phenylobacterium sp. Root77]|uniref:shikimate dehydrogenase n=1 Tax=unclassified Phenylobacterium TaxID=2640670 RepID=UPI0006F330C0|nr:MULTISPECIES: shikimate dehydrogenase [unclassified Phenylobacterium]KQW69138.1 shikimate dehydrogenase [Phenylobacterium sp. Root1277]KQW95496.1 shikimate dehydrogenase [Phenylobacterium sp. Root1290]KRC41286.1 shikimate dehydrogenase [Phenylobacterium sp. Root77]